MGGAWPQTALAARLGRLSLLPTWQGSSAPFSSPYPRERRRGSGKPDLPPPWEKAILTGGPLGPGKPVGPWGPLGPWEQRKASLRTDFFLLATPTLSSL